jgi:hypothetical protein
MVPIRDAARWCGRGGLALGEPSTIFDISRTSAPVREIRNRSADVHDGTSE